jgi:hypothetical protein
MIAAVCFSLGLMALVTIAWAEQLKKVHRRRTIVIKAKRLRLRCIRGGKS